MPEEAEPVRVTAPEMPFMVVVVFGEKVVASVTEPVAFETLMPLPAKICWTIVVVPVTLPFEEVWRARAFVTPAIVSLVPVASVKVALPSEEEVFTVSTVIDVVAREEVPVTEKVWVDE